MTMLINKGGISTCEVENGEILNKETGNTFLSPFLSSSFKESNPFLPSINNYYPVFCLTSYCEIMERHDKDKPHYHLDSVFSDKLDKKLMTCYKKANMLRKISFIMNTIKANAQYSNKGVEYDFHMAELHNTDPDEVELIRKCWEMRKKTAKSLMQDWGVFLKELEGVIG